MDCDLWEQSISTKDLNQRNSIMSKVLFVFSFAFLLATAVCAQTKEADLAGKWYDSSGDRLETELDSYIKDAGLPAIDGKIIAILSPHAGYAYS